MKRTGIIIGIVLLAVAITLSIYFFGGKGSGDREKVTIGMVTFPGYAPFYLAKEKGFFDDVEVDLVRIEAIGDLRAAMHSGSIDMYLATFDIFQATEGQEPPGIGFMAIDESHGADGVVVSEGIDSIQQFAGKRVGGEPGFPPYFILQYLLNGAGMTLNDVDFKDMASQDAGSAFVAGQLDIAATYEPYLSISKEKREGSKIFMSSADVPGLVVDLVFSNQELANEKPEVLEAIANGWFRAVEYILSNPDDAYAIMAKAFSVDVVEMKDFKSGLTWFNLDDNSTLFDPAKENNVFSTFDKVGEILVRNNQNGYRVSSKDKLTSSIVNALSD